MRWDLVIFDCDGVLIDSELLSIRAVRECLAECGINLSTDEILERYTGISAAAMIVDLEARHGPLPADRDKRHRRIFWPLLERELQAIPGVIEVIDSLTCKACVASGGRPERLKTCPVAGRPVRPLSPPHLLRRGGRPWQAGARSVSPRRSANGGAAGTLRRHRRQRARGHRGCRGGHDGDWFYRRKPLPSRR